MQYLRLIFILNGANLHHWLECRLHCHPGTRFRWERWYRSRRLQFNAFRGSRDAWRRRRHRYEGQIWRRL